MICGTRTLVCFWLSYGVFMSSLHVLHGDCRGAGRKELGKDTGNYVCYELGLAGMILATKWISPSVCVASEQKGANTRLLPLWSSGEQFVESVIRRWSIAILMALRDRATISDDSVQQCAGLHPVQRAMRS